MRPRSSLLSSVFLCTMLLAWGCPLPAHAALEVQAKAFAMPGMQLGDVQLRLDRDAEGHMRLQLSAKQASVAALGWRRVGLDLDGVMTRGGRRHWAFDGAVKLRGAPGGLLSDGRVLVTMDVDANTLEVDLAQGTGRASAALPLDQPTHAQISLQNMPLGWLQGVLANAWSGRLTGGRVDGTLALDVLDEGIRTSGTFSLGKAGFDSSSGSLASQGLGANGRLAVDTSGGTTDIDVDMNLRGGQLLLGPLYADLPAHDVHLAFSAQARRGAVHLGNLRFTDADALHLAGALDFAADGSVRGIDIDQFSANLPDAYERYGKTWLATLGFHDLRTAGYIEGSLDLDANGPQAFAVNVRNVDFADADGRLAVDGLDGGVDWRRTGTRPATTLGWRSLHVYRIANGAATGHWQSSDGALHLQQPMEVPVLGGELTMQSLDWRPAAKSGGRLNTSLALTGLDMAEVSRAFGWPEFKGTLGGAIPGLRYVDGRFDLDGGLSLNVFDGFIDVTRMSLQQPFGAAPVLAGDLALRQLDLAAITGVFDFGKITGRLDGKIADLRLVNWSPVAFEGELLAGGGGRISQRAVNNLTSVGGGGIAAGLQGAVLKLFDSFGYSRIGLKCTLQGAVCHMSGLKPSDDGYLIVDGRGLPHLKVVGHQHEVSWPTLVQRLQAATKGDGPVID